MLATIAFGAMLNMAPVHKMNLNQLQMPDTTPIIRPAKVDHHNNNGDDLNSDVYKGMNPYEAKIVYLESRGNDHITNGRYYGLFQLDFSYLKGDLSRKHQFQVAKQYLKDRYNNSWKQAYQFHIQNNWW